MNGWEATREKPTVYENWKYEVANGDTLLGFREFLTVYGGGPDEEAGSTLRSSDRAELHVQGVERNALVFTKHLVNDHGVSASRIPILGTMSQLRQLHGSPHYHGI